MVTKRSTYEATSRTRAQLKAQAALNGWETLDVLGAFLTPDGECIVITKDGRRFGIVIGSDGNPLSPSKNMTKGTGPKVYAPKSWEPEKWNDNVRNMRSEAMKRQEVIDWLASSAQEVNTPETHKRARQAIAVIEAMPDTPDWYDHLPLADVS